MYEPLIEELKNNHIIKSNTGTIIGFADRFLESTPYYKKTATPIMRIAEDLGFDIYETKNLDKNLSGVIYVGGTTKEVYSSDKIIFVDKNEPIKHQRFVIAHEIAHYLFDCLADDKYKDATKLFKRTYPKENHQSIEEFRADLFAAEILMPAQLFIQQYNYAMDQTNNRIFTIKYLSEFFQTKESSIEKRIGEILRW